MESSSSKQEDLIVEDTTGSEPTHDVQDYIKQKIEDEARARGPTTTTKVLDVPQSEESKRDSMRSSLQ